MLEPPFDIIGCSWPRPIEHSEGCWVSEPNWNAPMMPYKPQPYWTTVQGEPCWTVDWCRFFEGGLHRWNGRLNAEMRNFHVVFKLKVNKTGKLIFWDDDGSIIRRRDEIIHTDRTLHAPLRHEIIVQAGDLLEVAQWQSYGGWTWGANFEPQPANEDNGLDLLRPFLEPIEQRLRTPNGPALKIFCSGQTPFRTLVAIYSMLLNGYSPAQVFVFGNHQWSQSSHHIFSTLLPFAQIIPTEEVLAHIAGLHQQQLSEWARMHFLIMKTCVGVLCPPTEYCMMDDDVFILNPLDDALSAFQTCNLVFAPDGNYSSDYQSAWGWKSEHHGTLQTGCLNAGLYWLRHQRDNRALAAAMLRVQPRREPAWQWEQGFLATQFVDERIFELPTQRYFYPYFDGLPGGMFGYDYARNPCGFAAIHFGGLREKPSDAVALALASDILERNR